MICQSLFLLNDSLSDKLLINKGNDANAIVNVNGVSCCTVPYTSSGWAYSGIENTWYWVLSIHFTSTHTMQYWFCLLSDKVYQRLTTDNGSNWTVTTLH